jgi:uncharacterized protein (TIGR03086 family)
MADKPVSEDFVPVAGGVELLERALNYALGSLRLVTPPAMAHPTSCRSWDLRALLRHIDDSLSALHEAGAFGYVDIEAAEDDRDPTVDPVSTLRNRACLLLGAWTNADSPRVISIADHPLTTCIVTGAGAVEIAVHGWDVAQACGAHRPIPPALAEELLLLAPLLVADADRPAHFAAPVDVPSRSSSGDRLLAFLGRHPRQGPGRTARG